MLTVKYSQVRDQAARLVAAARPGMPATEADDLLGYLNIGLRTAWHAAPWAGLVLLDVFTPTDREVEKIYASDDFDEVLGVYDGNPRGEAPWEDVEWEDGDGVIALFEDFDSVYVDFRVACPNLLLKSGPELENFEVPARFETYLAYFAAGAKLTAEGLGTFGAARTQIAEAELAAEVGRLKWPARLSRVNLVN